MEPVFMVLGQSAATAAALAIAERCEVQKLDYEKLKKRLLADKQVLEFAAPPRDGTVDPKKLPGVVLDDADAKLVGFESTSTALSPFVGVGYRHDGNANRGKQSATFVPDLPATGKYEVRLAYTANPNRASNVAVSVESTGWTSPIKIDQRKKPPIEGLWVSLGAFSFEKGEGSLVRVDNVGADGFVVIDAVQWLPVKD
jgi:hypothetical protein